MAEDQDDSQKTEEPTQRRIEEALKRGQVPMSREVGNFLMLLALTLFAVTVMPWILKQTSLALIDYIQAPDQIVIDGGSLMHHFMQLLKHIAGLMMIVFVVSLVAAIFSNFVQNGFNISGEPIIPKLSKISPIEGFGRLFSTKTFVDFIKGLLKIIVVGYIAYFLIIPHLAGLELMPSYDLEGLLAFLMALCMRLLMWVCIFMFAVAAVDLLYQRFEFFKSLRMSRQELKEEYKETQGDPTIKARLRQIRQERARQRMMSAVPTADVVITNPTHYSIALQYDNGKMGAPVVVAKGVDFSALRIREVATANNIPIVQNPPLARALYDTVEIDEEIPVKHYQAVAEVISYVMKLKKPARTGTRH